MTRFLIPWLRRDINSIAAELLSSIPPVLFGDEDEDDDSADEDDSQLIDIFENLPDTHGEKIDDGGLMPMDDNKLGNRKFYLKKCSVFTMDSVTLLYHNHWGP